MLGPRVAFAEKLFLFLTNVLIVVVDKSPKCKCQIQGSIVFKSLDYQLKGSAFDPQCTQSDLQTSSGQDLPTCSFNAHIGILSVD